MNGLPSTIADFIELRRANAEMLEKAAGGMPNQFQRELIADLRDEANRLEAAWKREKATIEDSSAVGNAQKMREALANIVLTTLKVGMSMRGDVACGIIASRAKSALAAPPRNCDTMNWRNAWDAWCSKRQIGKPQSAKEVYDLMAQFLDWYTSANYEEGK